MDRWGNTWTKRAVTYFRDRTTCEEKEPVSTNTIPSGNDYYIAIENGDL